MQFEVTCMGLSHAHLLNQQIAERTICWLVACTNYDHLRAVTACIHDMLASVREPVRISTG